MKVLVTGGCGYIGSHACVALVRAGHQPIVLDNFSNSHPNVVARIETLIGQPLVVYQGDIRDRLVLDAIFDQHEIGAVMHFAGLKAVGESVEKPLEYYDNNLTGTLNLLAAMRVAHVYRLIFSSSATVYGDPKTVPITEAAPTGATTNPYGTSRFSAHRPPSMATQKRYPLRRRPQRVPPPILTAPANIWWNVA